jgi:hypothetical protein
MKQFNLIYKKALLMCLIMISLTLTAQTQKVLIVSLEDTTIVHCHLGITAFTNFKDTLKTSIPLSKIIEEKLSGYLSASFETHIINAPAEIKKQAFGFWGQSKEYKNWIKEEEKGYDYLIIINNIDISNEMNNSAMPKNTSGFYSRGSAHGVFTTINFEVYRTSNNQKIEYYNFGSKVFVHLKDFKMPEDKRTFDDQMLETIKNELIKQIDNRIKYFLAKTYILPNLE